MLKISLAYFIALHLQLLAFNKDRDRSVVRGLGGGESLGLEVSPGVISEAYSQVREYRIPA